MPSDDPWEDPFDDPDEAEVDLRPDDPSEGLGPEIPEAPSPTNRSESENEDAMGLANADVDAELKKQFWSLVLIFNVALFAASLGLMLVGFEGRWRVGGALFAVGAFAFLRGWYRYKSVRKD